LGGSDAPVEAGDFGEELVVGGESSRADGSLAAEEDLR
jgi:hypothetical protein